MASVDRTAYPRFKRNISVRELHEAYSPSLDEMDWARGLTGTDDHLLSLLVWLKSCQRLGYFPRPGEIPGVVAGHNGAGGSVVTGTLNWGFPVPVG